MGFSTFTGTNVSTSALLATTVQAKDFGTTPQVVSYTVLYPIWFSFIFFAKEGCSVFPTSNG